MLRSLLRVPLTLKLLVANGLFLAAAAMTGTAFGPPGPGGPGVESHLLPFLIILLVMVGVNGLLVRIALGPLKQLELAAARVRRGDLRTRVRPSPVADRAFRGVFRAFNQMVRSLQRTGAARDELARDLLEASEQDRKILAAELLGGAAQDLSTALLLLREAPQPDRDPDASGAVATVRSALHELRRIASELHPPELEDLGLATAIRALVRSGVESRGVRCTVAVGADARRVPPGISLEIFRLIQESIGLAGRFPELEGFRMRLRATESVLFVRLEFLEADPSLRGGGWAGLDAEAVLRRMAERARLLGGGMRLGARPGGTGRRPALTVRLRLPLRGPLRPMPRRLEGREVGLPSALTLPEPDAWPNRAGRGRPRRSRARGGPRTSGRVPVPESPGEAARPGVPG